MFIWLGCQDPAPVQYYYVKKIVKDKKQATKTDIKYKYNIWKGNFYHVPDIHDAFYLVYTDGTYDEVDVGKFTITNIGDTVTQKFVK